MELLELKTKVKEIEKFCENCKDEVEIGFKSDEDEITFLSIFLLNFFKIGKPHISNLTIKRAVKLVSKRQERVMLGYGAKEQNELMQTVSKACDSLLMDYIMLIEINGLETIDFTSRWHKEGLEKIKTRSYEKIEKRGINGRL